MTRGKVDCKTVSHEILFDLKECKKGSELVGRTTKNEDTLYEGMYGNWK